MSAQILVIEDDEDLRIKIEEFFIRQCHRPTGCGTLAEAAAALETMMPDAVLPDINLPDRDGMSFCMNDAVRFPSFPATARCWHCQQPGEMRAAGMQ